MTTLSQQRVFAEQAVIPAAALTLVCWLYLMLLTWVGVHAWDDGAITLAYARTVAEVGRFAVTPVSEVVEGSSSLLFVAAMAALNALMTLSFDGFIRASQMTALGAWLLTLLAVERQLRPHVPAPQARAILVGLLGILPMPMAEIFNGMEMTTLALLLVGLVGAFERRHVALFALIPLVLLVRFESVFYLGVAFAGLVLFRPRDRTWAWRAGLWTLAVWLLVAVWRWQVFGDWMPNTVRAKMHAPYMPEGHGLTFLLAKGEGLLEFLKVNLAWLLALGWLERRVAAGRGPSWAMLDLRAWLVLAFGVFAALSGANWGYQGRMCLAVLPLLFIWVAQRWSWLSARAGSGAGAAARSAFWPLMGLLSATVVINANVLMYDAKAVVRGSFYQGKLPQAVHERVAAHLQSDKVEFAHWMGVTPANFRATGLVVDRVRQSLGQSQIGLLTPDVGGLALCCPGIRVLDYGLLTSRDLAHTGYAGLEAYLGRERPDLIITHTFWSELSHIYSLPGFTRGYVPVVIDQMHMWLRRDHLAVLLSSRDWQSQPLADPQALKQAKYGGKPEDLAYVQSRGSETIWALTPQ